ncbi:hypothetical protein BJX66DRAFT_315086 [Aspergillus keveii]|uniref:Uncharacterized protein n=1 Tax=Aspergillus keveii TaxID=714993 RepID=A0ABR4FQK7_9EURO
MSFGYLAGSLAADWPSSPKTSRSQPKAYGLLLFRSFEQLDVFGLFEAPSLLTLRRT